MMQRLAWLALAGMLLIDAQNAESYLRSTGRIERDEPIHIRELTGVSPREGEAVIVRPDGEGLHVLGRIIFN